MKVFYGSLVSRYSLSGEHSPWQTWHLTIQVPHLLGHHPGDSVAIYPKNSSELVHRLLDYLSLDPAAVFYDERAGENVEAFELFSSRYDITRLSHSLLKALAQTASRHASRLALEEFVLQEGCLDGQDLLGILTKFFPGGIQANCLIPYLKPLLPRLYSISSGPSFDPHHIELTVAKAFTNINGAFRPGVCSGYLIDEVPLHSPCLKMFHQPSRSFLIPADETNKIFIATGTGIAPFRSLMQEHDLGSIPLSKYWLFFGGRKKTSDFFYEELWNRQMEKGHLTMTLAFSQDQEHKIYVQHRMWEERHTLWEWIENGASIYVCGNAKTMAKDVESCLLSIAQETGGKTETQAAEFLQVLRRSGRYRKDVY